MSVKYLSIHIEFNPKLDLAVTQIRQLDEQVKGINLCNTNFKRKKKYFSSIEEVNKRTAYSSTYSTRKKSV